MWDEPELRMLCSKTWNDANGDNENTSSGNKNSSCPCRVTISNFFLTKIRLELPSNILQEIATLLDIDLSLVMIAIFITCVMVTLIT